MQIQRGSLLMGFLKKWRKLGIEMLACASCDHREWSLSLCPDEEADAIPKDVPKGHMAVYVGEDHKRFIIRVTLLNHPLLRPLLDRAQEVYGYRPDSKLCIPCYESIFLDILQCAGSKQDRRMFWLSHLSLFGYPLCQFLIFDSVYTKNFASQVLICSAFGDQNTKDRPILCSESIV